MTSSLCHKTKGTLHEVSRLCVIHHQASKRRPYNVHATSTSSSCPYILIYTPTYDAITNRAGSLSVWPLPPSFYIHHFITHSICLRSLCCGPSIRTTNTLRPISMLEPSKWKALKWLNSRYIFYGRVVGLASFSCCCGDFTMAMSSFVGHLRRLGSYLLFLPTNKPLCTTSHSLYSMPSYS